LKTEASCYIEASADYLFNAAHFNFFDFNKLLKENVVENPTSILLPSLQVPKPSGHSAKNLISAKPITNK